MPQFRKDRLENNHYYHIFSRSIAKFVIFNDEEEFSRFAEIFNLYKYINFDHQYSKFVRLDPILQSQIIKNLTTDKEVLVEVIAYCIMPTHVHFILKQVIDKGISRFMSKILNCYTRYFNIKHKRVGPLWSSRFKSVLIENDEQLLHLTRYIHLNPTSAGLVKNPADWASSSYTEYVDPLSEKLSIYQSLISMSPKEYKKFVLNHKDYQKEISKIKKITIDDYTG